MVPFWMRPSSGDNRILKCCPLLLPSFGHVRGESYVIYDSPTPFEIILLTNPLQARPISNPDTIPLVYHTSIPCVSMELCKIEYSFDYNDFILNLRHSSRWAYSIMIAPQILNVHLEYIPLNIQQYKIL